MNPIRPEEITQLQDSAVQTFFSLINSEYTKKDYERRLKRVLCSMLKDVLKGNPQKIEEENRRLEQQLGNMSKKRGTKYNYPTADFEDRANELVDKAYVDSKWATALLLKIINKLKERSLLPQTDPDYLKKTSIRPLYFAVQGLLEMNEVTLPYKKNQKITS